MDINKIICGSALDVLKTMLDESIDCCITSPPYWGLRDYGTAQWVGGDDKCDHFKYLLSSNKSTLHDKLEIKKMTTGIPYKDICSKCGAKRIDNQIGLEKTPEEYVAKLVEIFREVKRVLKNEGTFWLNLGDSYNSSSSNQNGRKEFGSTINPVNYFSNGDNMIGRRSLLKNINPKNLLGIPWRVAFALQQDGWYLRQDIIWVKPNPMPESVTDRCTKSHEYIFLLTKSPKYYYDHEAIKEEASNTGGGSCFGKISQSDEANKSGQQAERYNRPEYIKRNRRSVWTITTNPFRGAHFATFPEDLVKPMILAGTSDKGICSDCGKPWVRVVDKVKGELIEVYTGQATKNYESSKAQNPSDTKRRVLESMSSETKTTGWKPICKCNKEPIPAIVFDPFMGAGTTGLVAKKLGRNYIGIELNQKYIDMANKRINSIEKPLF